MKLIEIYVLAWNKYINIAINMALLNWLLRFLKLSPDLVNHYDISVSQLTTNYICRKEVCQLTIGGHRGSWIYNYLCSQCLSPLAL